ncbi:MAG: hypothetical protein B7X91_04630 [Hydrogenophilales bacterium 17-64-11]|nr:MAG: hypothetical protein B7X91_04630 [Hydrogenophilales bacterium 17-64-11]
MSAAQDQISRRTITAPHHGNQYIDAIIRRDSRDVASIEKLDQLQRFLRAPAQTAGQLYNHTQPGWPDGLDGKTASRYVGVFEGRF